MKTLLVSFFVFFSALFGSTTAYNQWVEAHPEYQFGRTASAAETTRMQTLVVPDGKSLVPVGAIMTENNVNEVVYTYEIDIEPGNTLDVVVSDVHFTKADQVIEDKDHLLNFTIDIQTIDQGHAHVTVIVQLNMPETLAQYELVKGSGATFMVHFNQATQ